jgi:hypothetical protein
VNTRTPEEIRRLVAVADNEINSISLLLFNALSRANALREGSKVYENPAACNELDALCQYISMATGALGEVADYNREFETTADVIEAEDDSGPGPDNLIADCHEKLKAGLAGLGPGESYSITVRKDVENVVTTDMSAKEFAKRFRQNYQA